MIVPCCSSSTPPRSRTTPRELLPATPRSPARIEAIDAALAAADWLGSERRAAPAATRARARSGALARAHRPDRARCAAGGAARSTPTRPSARRSLGGRPARRGGAVRAGARARQRRARGRASRLLRPPGHHAERERAMGFCLFNNVAVAAQLAIGELGLERVLILDWDVHHGNGTAEIFRRRSDVLYASIHRAPFYPGTGAARGRRLRRGPRLHDQPARRRGHGRRRCGARCSSTSCSRAARELRARADPDLGRLRRARRRSARRLPPRDRGLRADGLPGARAGRARFGRAGGRRARGRL